MARILTVIFAVVFAAGSIGWLATFEVNLHCYQYTSFRIATFDRVAFEEDEGPPLVYRDGFAVPLRIYFAASILGFFLVPPLAGILAVRRVMTWRQWARITKGVSGLLLFNVLLPNIVVGERFWTLGAFSLAIAAIPLLILAGLVYWETGAKADRIADVSPRWDWELSIAGRPDPSDPPASSDRPFEHYDPPSGVTTGRPEL